MKIKDFVDILEEAKVVVEKEIQDMKNDKLSAVEELESESFYQGKLHVINGLLKAFKERR